jgi:hypothetical protein
MNGNPTDLRKSTAESMQSNRQEKEVLEEHNVGVIDLLVYALKLDFNPSVCQAVNTVYKSTRKTDQWLQLLIRILISSLSQSNGVSTLHPHYPSRRHKRLLNFISPHDSRVETTFQPFQHHSLNSNSYFKGIRKALKLGLSIPMRCKLSRRWAV